MMLEKLTRNETWAFIVTRKLLMVVGEPEECFPVRQSSLDEKKGKK